jgi:hypothetical protein
MLFPDIVKILKIMSVCNFFLVVWHKTRIYQSRPTQPVVREQHVVRGTALCCARREMTRENPFPGKAEVENRRNFENT